MRRDSYIEAMNSEGLGIHVEVISGEFTEAAGVAAGFIPEGIAVPALVSRRSTAAAH